MFSCGKPCQFQRHFNCLGPAIAEKCVLQISRRTHGHKFCQVSPQRIDQLLAVQGIPVQLCLNNLYDFRIPVAGRVYAESTKTVNKFIAVCICKRLFRICPFNKSGICGD